MPIEETMTTTWYNQHRQALQKRRILFIDQILNDNGIRILHWQQIRKRLGRQGKTPVWYNDLRTTICQDSTKNIYKPLPEITLKISSNHFKTNTPANITGNNQNNKWLATMINNETIYSKKKKTINPNTIIANHMITLENKSPLHKCTGCDINNQILRNNYIDQQQCILQQELKNSINISVQKSTISTLSQQSKAQPSLNRLRSTPTGITTSLKDIETLENIPSPPTIYMDNLSETIKLLRQHLKASLIQFKTL
jgi:hypothetical protein